MALLYGRAGRLTALFGGFRPGQSRRAARAEGEADEGGAAPARAGNRRFGLLSALRAHTKAPYKNDLL